MPKGYVTFTLDVRDEARLFEYIQAATPSVLDGAGKCVTRAEADHQCSTGATMRLWRKI